LGPIALGIIGFGYSRLAHWGNRSDDAAKIAMTGCFLAFFLRFPRDESVDIFRPLVWYAFLPYLATFVIRARSVGGAERLRASGHLRRAQRPNATSATPMGRASHPSTT